jgi:hypothetical protein
MSEMAVERFQVDLEPGESAGSFWHRLTSVHLDFAGDLAARAVAAESGGAVPALFSGGRIVIRESSSGRELWHVNASEMMGGTSPEQLMANIQNDLEILSADQFAVKWGIA